jgi:hypothetical protein
MTYTKVDGFDGLIGTQCFANVLCSFIANLIALQSNPNQSNALIPTKKSHHTCRSIWVILLLLARLEVKNLVPTGPKPVSYNASNIHTYTTSNRTGLQAWQVVMAVSDADIRRDRVWSRFGCLQAIGTDTALRDHQYC